MERLLGGLRVQREAVLKPETRTLKRIPFERLQREGYNSAVMSNAMVQILDEAGKLRKGIQVPKVSEDDLLRLYRVMLLNRRVDERMVRLQRQGRIGFYIGSIGEEASILGSAFALKATDWIIPCYREAGAAFWRGYTLHQFISQLFGTADDANKGRQMPNHYGSREIRFASISSPVGSQIPHATGVGLAAKLSGKKEVALVYFGDGATSQGDFHVACNFAGVFRTPTVFFCRNNQWAISVPLKNQTASESIAIKAQAYGFPGVQVDGNDIFGVIQVTREAVERAREGKGPTLIEALTYRQGAHSTSDDPRAYRDDKEVESWRKRDPLERFRKHLISRKLWDDKKEESLEAEIKEEIQETLRKVEAAGPPSLESMFEDVYESLPWNLREQQEEALELGPTEPSH